MAPDGRRPKRTSNGYPSLSPQRERRQKRSLAMDDSLAHVDPEERVLRVLDYELKSLKKDRKVYLQQPNSNLYFLCTRVDALSYLERERERLVIKKKVAKKPSL